MFILNCSGKAKLSNDFFLNSVCLLLLVVYLLSPHNSLTDKKIEHIPIQCDEILSLICNLNPNKTTGSDGRSGQMLLLCDNSVVLPLKIIFQNFMVSSSYLDMWKLANVIPIFKKVDKQLIKNYRPISSISNINSNIKFFAVETILFSVVQDSVKSATDLNHDLDMISQ